jgi:hypothetical protein
LPSEEAKHVTRAIALPLTLAGFATRGGAEGSEQWLQSFLSQLRTGEHLRITIGLGEGSGLALEAVACAPPAEIDARTAELKATLELVLASATPYLKPARPRRRRAAADKWGIDIRPAGVRVSLDDLTRLVPRPVTAASAQPSAAPKAGTLPLRLASAPERRPDLAAIAALMGRPELRTAELTLDLAAFRLDAAHTRAIQEFLDGLVSHAAHTAGHSLPLLLLNDRVLRQIKAWGTSNQGLALTARLSAPAMVPAAAADMLCQAIYGTTQRTDRSEHEIDLSAVWPDLDIGFLSRLPSVLVTKTRLDARRRSRRGARKADAVMLGRLDDGTPFCLDQLARQQHVYLIGGTGTGKSTLMLNMIAQDIAAGRGVILVDPHGDLWEKVLRLVPERRRSDLVLVHPTDERGTFTMNVLDRLSNDREAEHGRVIDELLDYFKRSQWKEVPDAFGPMFTNYFRSALLLVLSVEGDDASILALQDVFSDDSYRRKLIEKCPNKQVKAFWKDIVAHAEYEARLSNHAPYIVCKLSPIASNVHLKRILAANRSTLDFRSIIAGQKICLINLAGSELGKEASRFLGGMITARLVASAKAAQAQLPQEERIRTTVYLDEFQTYISAALADGLAEVRKFGLNLVLANQSFSQLHADRYQAEVAEAVMSNAANVIAFRVGAPDAARLAIRFEPHIPPAILAQLPNYYAAGLVMGRGGLVAPEVFATSPEPAAARRKRLPATGVEIETLATTRERIARLVAVRGSRMTR